MNRLNKEEFFLATGKNFYSSYLTVYIGSCTPYQTETTLLL